VDKSILSVKNTFLTKYFYLYNNYRSENMKNPYTHIISIILYCLLLIQPTHSQNNIASEYIFSSISIDDGLPLNFIDDILKDSHGFIWLSTQGGGLTRYDGYEFVSFNVNSKPASLKSNFIRKACEDNYRRLWIASNNGVDIIDLKTMTSIILKSDNKLLEEILNTSTNSIFKDYMGSIWFLTTSRIIKLSFDEKGNIKNICTTEKSTDSYFTSIKSIDNEVWVGNNGHICRMSKNESGNLSTHRLESIPSPGTGTYISAILKKDKNIWFGTENGLYKYDTDSKKLKVYTHNPHDNTSISQNIVTELSVTSDGTLVAGTLRGLNFYNETTDKFEQISHFDKENTLNNDFINCILPDKNNLWIGTEAGGLNKMTQRKLAVRNYYHSPDNKGSLSANPVNAIHEDNEGNLWVGTVEGGLNLKHKGEEHFIHYTAESGLLNHNSVSALEQDSNNNLWVGTWGGGITTLDINKAPKVIYKFTDVTFNYIGCLKYDPINNGMWIGTNRNIYFYDIESAQMLNPLDNKLTRNIMGTLGCTVIDGNKLWIGTSEGLIVIDLNSRNNSDSKFKADFFRSEEQSINQLFLKNITSLYQSKDKSIWLGSNGYGIHRLIPEGNRYKAESYTTVQGLANNTVLGILEDSQGLIWISTGRGISSYNRDTNRFANYTKNDGLINDQFYWNASYISPTNQNLYFGSMYGLTELDGSNQYAVSEQKKVTFTKLHILNRPVWADGNSYIKQDIAYTKHIDLHEKDKLFSIEFSALDYDNPSTVMYSYRLLGFDDKWIDVDANRRFASYTNLQPGNYRLQVRCMSKAYAWSDDVSELEIVVHPFFYKTTWFISLCLLLVIIAAVQFYRWRVNTLKKQKQVLHKKVEERTKELEEQKKLLEEQAIELKLQNNILFTQKEKISSQQKQIIGMSKKVQEAMADRMSFFTNITHEFRTPITLIIGPIERALKLSSNPKVIEQLQFVARNSKHLLSLVNQLMDFRKVESDKVTINPIMGNILKSVDEILIPFESFANERNIAIRKLYRLNQPYIIFDEEAIRKLITNLLSNAIKFTPDNGVVTLYISSLTNIKTSKDKIYICVSDSGIGIKNEDINRIFNRFYQSKGNDRYPIYGQSGTGIGLYLCKNIVELLGGKIYAKNNHARGASFRIILPLLNEDSIESANITEDYSLPIIIQEKREQNKNTSGRQKMTLLVVEDNADMRKYISSILSDYYRVEEVENGQEALNILKSKSIDFIISDLMMPVMDGLELSQKVKADFSISHIPFLMLTAKTSLETQISSYKIGVDEFLAKPFDDELLLARINNILESRKVYQRKFSLDMNPDELNIAEESRDDKFLRKAVDIVKNNYKNTEYEVSNFVEDMGVSKSLLNSKMQMLTGQSAGNFIRNYRLNIAKELIIKSQGKMNISEVAFEVGFNDPKYFTRCFTKHYGIAPSMVNKDNGDK